MALRIIASICLLFTIQIALSADLHSHKKYPPIPYSFSYGVYDPYEGADYGRQESSDGKVVKGSYTVQLPDGRKQIVTYTADHYNGFQAEVRYEGKAQYPSKSEYPPFVVKPSFYH